VVLSQVGGVREYGRAEDDMPFPLECNLPIVAQKSGAFRTVCREVKKSNVVIFFASLQKSEDIAKVRSLTLGHLGRNRLAHNKP
jgi:hypothetical protein